MTCDPIQNKSQHIPSTIKRRSSKRSNKLWNREWTDEQADRATDQVVCGEVRDAADDLPKGRLRDHGTHVPLNLLLRAKLHHRSRHTGAGGSRGRSGGSSSGASRTRGISARNASNTSRPSGDGSIGGSRSRHSIGRLSVRVPMPVPATMVIVFRVQSAVPRVSVTVAVAVRAVLDVHVNQHLPRPSNTTNRSESTLRLSRQSDTEMDCYLADAGVRLQDAVPNHLRHLSRGTVSRTEVTSPMKQAMALESVNNQKSHLVR